MPLHRPTSARRLGLCLAFAGVMAAAVPSAAGAFDILYVPDDAADAAYDAGLTEAVRQMPAGVYASPRWPSHQRIGKISVKKLGLYDRSAEEIVRIVRHELAEPGNSGRAAMDELNPNQWSAAQARELRKAWVMLGDDTERVAIYAAPSFVGQVGRADPRRRLDAKQQRLFDVLKRSGATYLQAYGGGWVPLDATTMAGHFTRWIARWPAGRLGELRLLVGPGIGITQEELWNRVRATPAGRTLLDNGVGMVGGVKMSPAEAVEWVRQYRGFQEAPTASPPGGDITPPLVGAPVMELLPKLRAGGRFNVTANRAGKAAIQMLPLTGKHRGHRRVIAKLLFPAAGPLAVSLPRDSPSGRYRLKIVFYGGGIRETATAVLKVIGRR